MVKGIRVLRLAKAMLLSGPLLVTSCGGGGHRQDVKPAVDLDVRIGRLDQDLFRGANDTSVNFSLKLYATYGDFYRTYVERILQAAPVDDPRLPIALIRFTHDPDWRSVQQRADSVLGDLEPQRAEFEEAFERLKTFFPDSLVPRLIAFNSGFNYGVLPTDSVLGFGVEWFIGKDHRVVGYLSTEVFPQYVKDRMRPEMLVPSAVKGWLQVHYARDVRGADLLTQLVEVGKVMVLLDALLPATDPALKFAFTQEQLKWCEDNEFNCWKEIVAHELLYSKKEADIGRFLNDGPFTPGFPRESPGHLGEWIGYRMVDSYLRVHPDVTLAQLFALDDPRAILKTYKPR